MENQNIRVRNSRELNLLVNRVVQLGPKITQNQRLVKMAIAVGENAIIRDARQRKKSDEATPAGVIDDQTAMSLAILHTVSRLLSGCKLSEATYQKAATVLGRDLLLNKELRLEKSREFIKKFGISQPSFLLISPSKACNLRCTGCYADSDAQVQTLDWDIVDRMVDEAHTSWGVQFIVISGGEPMAYRSQGKTILDLAEKHPEIYFMFYTNGTLITDEIAQRMASLGNLIPMISLEGWKERTDARRGEGVFDRVMAAMDRLYSAGVLYGVSLTATRENAMELLAEDFMDFLFLKKHAAIAWIFQYMPIGRSFTLDLMPTPQQRLKMWDQSWKMVIEKHYFIADFWNHGTVVDGCLSAGGHGNGGYLYVDWNGNISPCVFLPYTPVNIREVYARGGTLEDIFQEPFFADLRKWQADMREKTNGSNLLNPCPMRDHHADLRQLIRKHEVDPADVNAAAALQDAAYARGMDDYDARYQRVVDALWDKVYLKDSSSTTGKPTRLSEAELEQILQEMSSL